MSKFLAQLTGGDRRSIGKSNLVVKQLLADPSKFRVIIAGLSDNDPLIRMRSADVAEKVSAIHPEWLQPHKRGLLALAMQTKQKEVRWHLAQMLSRLRLTPAEKSNAISTMLDYLKDDSRIVKTFAMQALAEFAESDDALRDQFLSLLKKLHRTGSPAIRSRARRLIAQIDKL